MPLINIILFSLLEDLVYLFLSILDTIYSYLVGILGIDKRIKCPKVGI